jgi:hypothetical protein
LHPIWEDHIGWIATTSGSLKIRQIQRRRQSRIWDLFAATPPRLGHDPAVFWKAARPTRPNALLRLDPTRIELTGLRHRSSG